MKSARPTYDQGNLTSLGPVKAPTPGRTDLYDRDVPDGSYVIPADVVSALGDGNTDAGHERIKGLFPAGKKIKGLIRHSKIPKPAAMRPKGMGLPYADGGHVVPITTAAGEHILSPDQVAHQGEGDAEIGKAIIDEFVKHVRDLHIDTLANLPPPKGSR